LAVLPSIAEARCGDRPADATELAVARADVAASCSCSGLPTHGAYVACVRGVVAQHIEANLLSGACGAAVKRCGSNSTCGSPGAVACCTTLPSGKTRCTVKKSAALCRAPRGGSACASQEPSCCDACTSGGCATPTPTPTATPTPSSFPYVPCDGGSGAPMCDG